MLNKIGLMKTLCGVFIMMVMATTSWAQASLKDVSVIYNKIYQLDKSYTIIYNNLEAPVKLNEFQIEFYGPTGENLGNTGIRKFSLEKKAQGFDLQVPIIGFQQIKLSIISLHAGDIAEMSSGINPALGLTQDNEVTSVPILVNTPPIARNGTLNFEASTAKITGRISDLYTDRDGDKLRVSKGTTADLDLQLAPNGTFTIETPNVTGQYDVSYVVTDTKNATATGRVTINLTLPDTIRFALEDAALAADQARMDIREKVELNEADDPMQDGLLSRLETLISQNLELSSDPDALKNIALKTDVNSLTDTLALAKAQASKQAYSEQLSEADNATIALKTQITALQTQSGTDGADIVEISNALAANQQSQNAIATNLRTTVLPEPLTKAQIEAWEAEHVALKNRLPSFNIVLICAGLAALAFLAAIVAKLVLSAKAKTALKQITNHASRPQLTLNKAAPAGVIFPTSPLLAAHVSAPLTGSAQLTASQLQSLTGPYSVLRRAYQATGRIGFAQVGVPSSEDYSFGTGFLISDRHVVTNRHVFGLYGHYLMSDNDPGGIEFIAEKGSELSDFVPFKNEPPRLITGLDIAIFELARPVRTRKPMRLKATEIESLETRNIIAIGYPDTHKPNDPEILSVVENDPVFAVKRISQGQIFRHSTDTGTPFGVQTSVDETDEHSFTMPAICHNASTMGGNSGSPLLDIRTGELLGVHFAGFKIFNQKEAANLAMTIKQLTEGDANLSQPA